MAVNMEKWKQLGSLNQLQKDFQDTPKGKRLRSLLLNEVVSVAQVRRTFAGLEELAESLKEVGQQSPIMVRPKNAEGKYVILQGERRWRAAQMAGFNRIDAVVVEGDVETTDRILGQLTENIQRDDMRPLEIAAAIKELLDSGLKGKDIAQKLGYQASFVTLYRDLLTLPEMVYQLAAEDKIRDARTLQILKKIFELRPDIAEDLIRRHLDNDGGITRSAARSLLNRCQSPEGDKPDTPQRENVPSATSSTSSDSLPSDEGEVPEQGNDGARQGESQRGLSVQRHKLADEDEEIDPKDFAIPQSQESLPEGGRRMPFAQVSIKVSMLDEAANDVLYGVLVPNIVSDNPSEVCVLTNGRFVFWPVSQVHLENVTALKDNDQTGW